MKFRQEVVNQVSAEIATKITRSLRFSLEHGERIIGIRDEHLLNCSGRRGAKECRYGRSPLPFAWPPPPQSIARKVDVRRGPVHGSGPRLVSRIDACPFLLAGF